MMRVRLVPSEIIKGMQMGVVIVMEFEFIYL